MVVIHVIICTSKQLDYELKISIAWKWRERSLSQLSCLGIESE